MERKEGDGEEEREQIIEWKEKYGQRGWSKEKRG